MVSNIGDNYRDTFPNQWPQFVPQVYTGIGGASQADLDALRKDVQELKKLLTAANEYDKATGQPHCEMDEKVELIKKVAKLVGVDLGDVFKPA